MNFGTMITAGGSIMVLIIRMKRGSRPGKSSRENPNATRELEMITPTTPSTVITRVFQA